LAQESAQVGSISDSMVMRVLCTFLSAMTVTLFVMLSMLSAAAQQTSSRQCDDGECFADVEEVPLVQLQKPCSGKTRKEKREPKTQAPSGTFGGSIDWVKEAAVRIYPELHPDIQAEFEAPAAPVFDKLSNSDWLPEHSCDMMQSSCPFSNISQTNWTIVYPGGNSMCMWGSPYGFLVKRGDPDKLLFYFQGGGGCFSSSALGQMCYKELTFEAPAGILNTDDPQNPFKGWTVVYPMYCDGAVFGSNATQEGWPPIPGATTSKAQLRGYYNARATLDWVKANFGHLSNLFVSGDSAGAMGAQLWAKTILSELDFDLASVVPDSYVGVFPPSFGPKCQEYGLCDLPLLGSDALIQMCRRGKISIMSIFNDTITTFAGEPTIRFGMISSKYDFVQMTYYSAFAISYPDVHALPLNPWGGPSRNRFYGMANAVFQEYNKNDNFKLYLVSATMHTYTELDVVYNASTVSWNSRSSTSAPMIDWISKFIPPGENAEDRCDGKGPSSIGFLNIPHCGGSFTHPIANCNNAYCATFL